MLKRWEFIVDTDTYAGNFLREMCAYMTGAIGECGVGHEQSLDYKREVTDPYYNLAEAMILMSDDDDRCMRPVCLEQTPGWFNNGLGGTFPNGKEKEAYEKYLGDIEVYKLSHPSSTVEIKDKLIKYPAYLSIKMVFRIPLPTQHSDLLQRRAHKFLIAYPDKSPSQIIGFRYFRYELVKKLEWSRKV